MYSDKTNVNILTALLVEHGVRHAVVCPGSRNAPITHNLCECQYIECVSVTDERSAAFIAMGWAQTVDSAVAVCVTSGSALLNTLPAVAEAFYQHCPLVIISADRPEAMIGQLQGQTLPQPGALSSFVRKTVSLPEPHDDTERWHCNRLVNEALIAMRQQGGGPVHINVPITEPLFRFTCAELPRERMVSIMPKTAYWPILQHKAEEFFDVLPFGSYEDLAEECMENILPKTSYWPVLQDIAEDFFISNRPMVVIGQLPYALAQHSAYLINYLRKKVVVLLEQLSNASDYSCHLDEALSEIGDDKAYQPDYIIYFGDTLVSKRAKHFLQHSHARRTIIVNETGCLTDVTMHATDILEGDPWTILAALAYFAENTYSGPTAFFHRWRTILGKWSDRSLDFKLRYSQMQAVRLLHSMAERKDWTPFFSQPTFYYANSSAVRLGQLFSTQYIHVNRGVNGIEGCLSTAVGATIGTKTDVYCVIGDLAFFYDQNALWNNLGKYNLRILLLNNGCGGIFHQLPGLGESRHRDQYVSASHNTSARGVCEAMRVAYMRAENSAALASGMEWLTGDGQEPRLLEVMTDAETDAAEMRRYYAEQ